MFLATTAIANSASTLPLVSALLITYNQAAYIHQALDGILMQQGPFQLEIVVGNDCSTDETSTILDAYADRHPGVLRLLPQKGNLGLSRNLNRCLPACRGKYVALIEGDDYWTDPQKLARQVAFLEAYADFSLCFHNAQVVYEDGTGKPSHPMTTDLKPEYTLDDITRDWNIANASVVYRNGLLPQLPPWVHEGTATDLPMLVIVAEQGRVGCLPEVMSVYRVNRGGVTRAGKQERHMLGIVRMHENVDRYLDFRYHRNFVAKLAEDYTILAGLTLASGERLKARRYLLRAMRYQLAGGHLPNLNSIKALIGTVFPGLVSHFGKASRQRARIE